MSDDAPRTLVDLTKARRFTVRQILKAVAIVSVLLFVTSGPGIREAGEQMQPGSSGRSCSPWASPRARSAT